MINNFLKGCCKCKSLIAFVVHYQERNRNIWNAIINTKQYSYCEMRMLLMICEKRLIGGISNEAVRGEI